MRHAAAAFWRVPSGIKACRAAQVQPAASSWRGLETSQSDDLRWPNAGNGILVFPTLARGKRDYIQAASRAWASRRLARSTRATGTWAAKHRLPTGFQFPVSGLQSSKLAGPRQRRQLEDSALVVHATTVGTSDTSSTKQPGNQPRLGLKTAGQVYTCNRDLGCKTPAAY